LDVDFREDASRVIITTNGPKNLGILRRVALNLKKREIKNMKSFRARLTNVYLEKI
jgi:hypothetical protein